MKVRDCLYEYPGGTGSAVAHLRVYRIASVRVAIVGQLSDSSGASIINRAAVLHAQLRGEYGNRVVVVEHHPAGSNVRPEPTWDVVEVAAGTLSRRRLPSRAAVETLVGEPVDVWPAAEYTITALQSTGRGPWPVPRRRPAAVGDDDVGSAERTAAVLTAAGRNWLAALCRSATAVDDDAAGLPLPDDVARLAGAEVLARDEEHHRDLVRIGDALYSCDDGTGRWHPVRGLEHVRAPQLLRRHPLTVTLGLPGGAMAVHLLEGRSGVLIVLCDGFAWVLAAIPDEAPTFSVFAERWADNPVGVLDAPGHRVNLRVLAAHFHDGHSAIRHVATWTPGLTTPSIGPTSAAVTLHAAAGPAATAWLGPDAGVPVTSATHFGPTRTTGIPHAADHART